MKVRALDGNWDFMFGKGKQCYATESLATAYDAKQKILSWYNDCFFDMQSGIDYKNLLGSKNGKIELDNSVKKILAVQPDIVEITYFESSVYGRQYHLTARFKTIYGETIEVKV
jgi:hypothetical protein